MQLLAPMRFSAVMLTLGVATVSCAGSKKPTAPDELRQGYVDAIWETVDDKERRRVAIDSVMRAIHLLEDVAVLRRESFRRFGELNRDYDSSEDEFVAVAAASAQLRARVLDRYLEMRARLVETLTEEEWSGLYASTQDLFRHLVVVAVVDTDRDRRFLGFKGGSPVQARWFEGLRAEELAERARSIIDDEQRLASTLALTDALRDLDESTLAATLEHLEAYEALAGGYATSPVTLRSRVFQLAALNDAYEVKLMQLRSDLRDTVDRDEWALLFAPRPAPTD